jgi:ribosomal protein S15P/S13E
MSSFFTSKQSDTMNRRKDPVLQLLNERMTTVEFAKSKTRCNSDIFAQFIALNNKTMKLHKHYRTNRQDSVARRAWLEAAEKKRLLRNKVNKFR